MDSKDTSYIKNYVMSKSATIGDPGFLLLKISGKTPMFSRRVLIPEDFFVTLEKALALKGMEAQRAMYSGGKKFGYAYALLAQFMTVNDRQGQDLLNFINLVNKQIQGTFAKKIECNVDFNSSSCTYDLTDFVIVEKLGFGYFLPLGGAAGMIAYILQNETIEGVIESSDAKHGTARILYAPGEYLKAKGKEFFYETNLSGLEPSEEYMKFNEVRQLKYSDYSFEKLLNAGVFTFDDGAILSGSYRYFMLEDHGFYMLERELKNYSKELYDAGFSTGMKILEGVKDPKTKIIVDYLSAFGWGDPLIIQENGKYVVNLDYFPYTKFYKDVRYSMFSGIIAGMLFLVAKRKINFSKIVKSTVNGYLSISLFEE